MRRGWLGAICLLVALFWLGCTNSPAPGSANLERQEASPTSEAVATPTEIAPTATVAVSPSPEATATPVVPNSPPATATPQEEEPTPPASAEGPGRNVPSRADPTFAPYTPQPIPLSPFQPANGRARVVTLDPGHGGPEVGGAGAGVAEKDVNLSIALKLKKLLEQDGMKVALTRDSDRRAYELPADQVPQGYSATRLDVQTRVDIANKAQSDAFISIHNNSSGDTSLRGTEVWYDGKRPFAAFNKALATDVLSALVASIRAAGYPTVERGLKEDSQFMTFQGRSFPIFVLGPPRTGSANTRASQMPAVLGETLFLSNPTEAQALSRDDMQLAIAKGYRDGLVHYFQSVDSGSLVMPPGGFPLEQPNHYDVRPPGSEQR